MTAMVNFADFRAEARRKLPHFLFEYYDGGAFDEVTARANEHDMRGIVLPQSVLMDVPDVSTATRVLGADLSLPLVLGPVGLAGMASRRGEVAAAQAAAQAGIPICLSTASVCPLDEVAGAAIPWFQLYMLRDRDMMQQLLNWVASSGCTTLVLTVDVPVLGTRWRDSRSGLNDVGPVGQARRSLQIARRPGWAFDVGLRGGPHTLGTISHLLGGAAGLGDCMGFMSQMLETRLGLDCLAWVRDRWAGNLVVKGVLSPEDAERAIAAGADAIVVSNHGGRQLDGVQSTAAALPGIVRRVRRRVPVLVDGGIRSGLDIARILSLGADAAMIGRPWLFALAAGGMAGVRHMIANMESELRIAMTLSGRREIADFRTPSEHEALFYGNLIVEK